MYREFGSNRGGRAAKALLVATAAMCAGLAAGAVSAQPPAATTVAPVTVAGGAVPVPNVGQGARMYTVEEIRQLDIEAGNLRGEFEDAKADLYDCYQTAYSTRPNPERTIGYEEGADAARRLSVATTAATNATVAAQQARIDAGAGKATQAQVEQTELARQAAIREMAKAKADMDEGRAKAIDTQQLVRDRVAIADWNHTIMGNAAERLSRKNPLIPKAYEDLVLENIKTVQLHDTKGGPDYLSVSGAIRNASARKVDMPGLSVTVSDQFGFPLFAQTNTASAKIDPGQSKPFVIPVNPSPANAARVAVTFAGVSRASQLDPVSADPVCSAAAPPELNPNISGGNNQALPSARTMQLNAPSMQSGPVAGQIAPPSGARRTPQAQ